MQTNQCELSLQHGGWVAALAVTFGGHVLSAGGGDFSRAGLRLFKPLTLRILALLIACLAALVSAGYAEIPYLTQAAGWLIFGMLLAIYFFRYGPGFAGNHACACPGLAGARTEIGAAR